MRRGSRAGVAALMAVSAALIAAEPVASSAFPGANGKIAFQSRRDGNGEIYVMNPNGSNQTNLTNNSAQDFAPNWSADGKKIAFISTRDADGNAEIFVMNADGSDVRQITFTAVGVDNEQPSWSPDGERIAFWSDRSGNYEIYVMDNDGSDVRRLTNNPAVDSEAQWSPDGEQITFVSLRDGNREIYTMDDDGSDQQNLSNSPLNDTGPCWSPDADQIVFSRNTIGVGDTDVWVMNADGSDQRNVSNHPVSASGCFSPDGEEIVFVSLRDAITGSEIYVMDADGSDVRRLTTNGPATDTDPNWQPEDVTGDVVVTKWVNGTAAPGTTFTVDVVCDNGDDTTTQTLTFGETGGTQSIERESFGPLECHVTETGTGGATSVAITCASAENAECKDDGSFVLFDDPGGDDTHVDITVTNTFPVVVEPTFTG